MRVDNGLTLWNALTGAKAPRARGGRPSRHGAACVFGSAKSEKVCARGSEESALALVVLGDLTTSRKI